MTNTWSLLEPGWGSPFFLRIMLWRPIVVQIFLLPPEGLLSILQLSWWSSQSTLCQSLLLKSLEIWEVSDLEKQFYYLVKIKVSFWAVKSRWKRYVPPSQCSKRWHLQIYSTLCLFNSVHNYIKYQWTQNGGLRSIHTVTYLNKLHYKVSGVSTFLIDFTVLFSQYIFFLFLLQSCLWISIMMFVLKFRVASINLCLLISMCLLMPINILPCNQCFFYDNFL